MLRVIRFIEIIFVLIYGAVRAVFIAILFKIQGKKNPLSIKGAILCYALENLGPVYQKVGQILASRPDIIGTANALRLSKLQRNIRPIAYWRIRRIIQRNYQSKIDAVFPKFEKRAIASGSIAQVHVATLNSGKIVAVKIKRPRLSFKIKRDFGILRSLVKLISKFKKYRDVPMLEILKELEFSLHMQVYFELEMKNAECIRNNFFAHPFLKIPEMYLEFCREDVIVMEYLSEINVAQEETLNDEQKEILCVSSLRMLYKMIFVDGLVHADLHMGNIQFRENSIYLIDFGLIASLSDDLRGKFREFFFAMVTNNADLCSRIIQDTAIELPPEFDENAFTKGLKIRLSEFSGKSVLEFEVVQFAEMLFDIQRKFKIRGTSSFVMAILSLLMFEGTLKEFYPKIEFQVVAINFLLDLKDSEYTREQRVAAHQDLKNTVISSRS